MSATCLNIAMAKLVNVRRMSLKRTGHHADLARLASQVGKPFDYTHNVLHIRCPVGYCFQGYCPTLSLQCEAIWGYGGSAADRQCYEQFNSKGSINGHCGRDANEHYIKCEPE